ncbi:leucine-rich repeat domain-containing protein [Thiomicrospira microaerophila]|uniref:leucine-rich repeat domain-containing protein n=1 Tax=Thiomicrospira microaerophila TaxID=406020 RepID=UPI0005CAD3F0|nr:leucine-rich repeat domain-containing protein [Thiomicrospira microaerophila]
MTEKKLPQTTKNTSVAKVLKRSNKLMNVTQNVLQRAKSAKDLAIPEDDSWMERLCAWADENGIPDLTWVDDFRHIRIATFGCKDLNELLHFLKRSSLKEYYSNILQCYENWFPAEYEGAYEYEGTYVIVSGYWTGLPRDKEKLKYLTHLDLDTAFSFQTVSIPPEIGNLKYLTHLNIPNIDGGGLPSKIENLKNLTYLNIRSLKNMPECILSLKNLKYLDSKYGPICRDAFEIYYDENGTEKNIISNDYKMAFNVGIKELILGYGDVGDDYRSSFCETTNILENIEIESLHFPLDLITSEESVIIQKISKLKNLRQLRFCLLLSSDLELNDMANLKKLNYLSVNVVIKLSELERIQFPYISSLEHLSITISNSYSSIPSNYDFINLDFLNIPYTLKEFRILGGYFGNFGFKNTEIFSMLSDLEVMDVSSIYFLLPDEVCGLKNIKKLSVCFYSDLSSENNLSILSKLTSIEDLEIVNKHSQPFDIQSLKNLKSLRKLTIVGCFENSSQEFGLDSCFPELSELYINGHDMSSINDFPTEIFQLETLKLLDISGCKIKFIPEGISQLVNLQILNLSQNCFSEFPLDVTKLKNLRVFRIAENRIQNLPTELRKLKKLEILDISQNSLRLTEEILQVASLTDIYCSRNVLAREYLSYEQYNKSGFGYDCCMDVITDKLETFIDNKTGLSIHYGALCWEDLPKNKKVHTILVGTKSTLVSSSYFSPTYIEDWLEW